MHPNLCWQSLCLERPLKDFFNGEAFKLWAFNRSAVHMLALLHVQSGARFSSEAWSILQLASSNQLKSRRHLQSRNVT